MYCSWPLLEEIAVAGDYIKRRGMGDSKTLFIDPEGDPL